MPPFVPRKRLSSQDPPSPPPAKRSNATPSAAPEGPDPDASSDTSSLSDAPDDESSSSSSSDSEEVDWEDAMDANPPILPPEPVSNSSANTFQSLELTLDRNEVHHADLLDGKKAPSKIERQIRIQSHCMHVQFLLFHNAIRNYWCNDPQLHDLLRRKLPSPIQKEITKWRVASGLEQPEPPKESTSSKKKGKGKQRANPQRDWGDEAARQEPGQPDMSRGDPLITLLRVLAAYWKKQFKITAPGLRKHGYMPAAQLSEEISSFHKGKPNPVRHGERICSLEEFRQAAEKMEGSRDLGAQLFTALLRALGLEARLVASLQPLGFGWTKAETYTPKPKATEVDQNTETGDTEGGFELDTEDISESSDIDERPSRFDSDLPFPIYWTEVPSPITHEIIPVDPLILQHPVATTPELQAAFEPRGAKAEKSKQVICYVIAYSPDKTAKDVTTRYLRRRTWPGKTKGFRMPVEKIPIPGRKGKFFELDWFRTILRVYERPPPSRTAVDSIEDTKDLVPNQPEKKAAKEGDTLQSLRSSEEFVLERFLRREEALKPTAQHVRTFTSGKGAKAKEEKVFLRADVVKCLSAESWHKEGRQIKPGATPLKRVPIRAVTLLRKREVDELERETGEKPKQGLYAKYQTEWIIPPPIRDGVIPKNEYGNIDCFVPRMVPRGAMHIPWPGTVRICKKLGIDYAEAVTGFEFGSKMAVPVIQGVVVAVENGDVVKDAWRADAAEKQKREQLKAEARILQTWKKFLFGLRIAERVREEYGDDSVDDHRRDSYNPFAAKKTRWEPPKPATDDHAAFEDEDKEGNGEDSYDGGGGFLLPGEDDDDDDGSLVIERNSNKRQKQRQFNVGSEQEDEEENEAEHEEKDEDEDENHEVQEIASDSDSSSVQVLSPPPEIPDSDDEEVEDEDEEEKYTPRATRTRRTRNTRG